MLAAERPALNTMQHLSGIATLTRRFVEAIDGTGATLIDTLSDEELVRSVDAICVLAAAEVMLDLPLQATAHSDRGLAVAEASGHAALQIHYWTATVRTMRGQLRSAAEVFDNAIEISRVTDNGPGLVWNLCGRSFTAGLMGDHAVALSCARETRELLRGVARSFVSTAAGQALAGALFTARYGTVDATAGTGYELSVIAAAVVGGVAITGGVGSVYGAAIGAVLMGCITSSLIFLKIDAFWQQAAIGALLLVAIAFDRFVGLRLDAALRQRSARRAA